MGKELVRLDGLYKSFPLHAGIFEEIRFENRRLTRKRQSVNAINGVDLSVRRGEALCVVGESGCGKSTVAGLIMGFSRPTADSIRYDGARIDGLSAAKLLAFRRRMQMIFQNSYASLNPRMTVAQTLEEPIQFHHSDWSRADVQAKASSVMSSVGVDPGWSERFSHEFSGGQRQRISIARAVAADPEFIVADQPILALDVSIQTQVLNLLMDAREQRSLTYLFITQDLSVVEHFGNRVGVMYLGTVCEVAQTRTLFCTLRHPYTQALLSAIPCLNQQRSAHVKLSGEVPTPVNLPSSCVFHGRCIHADQRCRQERLKVRDLGVGTQVACRSC